MGLVPRKKSGLVIGGSKLIVPGEGIYTVKPNYFPEQVSISSQNKRPHSRPTPTPTPNVTQTPSPSVTQTPTPTPTPTSSVVCYLSTENLFNLLTENGNNLILDCGNVP